MSKQVVAIAELAVTAPIPVAIAARTLVGDLALPGLHPRMPLISLCDLMETLFRLLATVRIAELAAIAGGALPKGTALKLHRDCGRNELPARDLLPDRRAGGRVCDRPERQSGHPA